VIPPEADAEFVACMEDVLDVYERPYDPNCPVVNMDEQPVQLVKEVRRPLEVEPGQPRRYDHEYERAGTASIFLFTEALGGWRQVSVRPQRTAVDWAQELAALLEGRYAQAPKVIVICDQLNTHVIGSLYKAFPPERARRLAQRLDLHYTPKHGSWLNIAECELSVLTRQCLRNRTASMAALVRKVTPWGRDRNTRQCGVVWQFRTKDARIKLKRLYPEVQLS
jgi:DDE superfamily endonuclease